MFLYYVIVMFLLGITMGSFYNVVGYRLPNNQSLIKPRSHCPNCNHKLTALELIPIFSYLFQKGKCKNCKVNIPPFYVIFEFITGILFSLSYIKFGFSLDFLIAISFSSLIVIITISDFLTMIIPDEVVFFFSVLFLIFMSINNGFTGFINALGEGIISFLIIFFIKKLGDFIFKKESMGGGDLKLLFVFGLVIGYQMSLLTIFLASFIALPIALIVLFLKKDNIVPFGPFLGIAALIIYFFQIDFHFVIELLKLI